jgi:ethanolamine-phosphate cytidylyltransferase
VLNLNERVLSVLACKYVDDVIIDPPYLITAEMIAALNINIVVTGKISEVPANAETDVYRVPQEMGILKEIDSGSSMTMGNVLTRIRENASRLENKVAKKMKAEAEHFKDKHGLANYNTGFATETKN